IDHHVEHLLLLAPHRHIGNARNTQQAWADLPWATVVSSRMFSSLEEMPIFIVRAVEERGGSMVGAAAQVGSVGVIWARRSCTSRRATIRSVPGSKMSLIEDNCSTDFERITANPGVPLSTSSSGTVIYSSTSVEDSPRQGVWISTWGGAN